MIEAEWWDYDSPDEWADAVAGDIGFIVDSATDARNAALLAMPAAPECAPVLQRLAKAKLPWKKVAVVPTDDRLVPVSDERSAVRTLAAALIPAGARVLPVATENPDVALAGNAADARLQDLPWPPDLVWLTVDEAGNTAGLTAGPDLQGALDAPKARRAVGLRADNGDPRVSLTRAAILSARTILITLVGDEARQTLERAIADGHSSKLPIGRVLAEAEQPIDIHWYA
jgi:6-phosphogluconolactonase